jgi:hypothetical protein
VEDFMKLISISALLLTFATLGFAQQAPAPKAYDEIMKISFDGWQGLLNVDGKQFYLGDLGNEKFQQEIAWDPKAQQLFRESASAQNVAVFSGLAYFGLFVGGAGLYSYAERQPKDSNGNNTTGWISVGMLFGGLVALIVSSSYAPTAAKKLYEGINQYNYDVLAKSQ